MKRLKEYIELQQHTEMSDMEVIVAYFVDNDMEEVAMDAMHKLASAKIEKMRYRDNFIKTWAYSMPSEYLYKTYALDIASNLHRIELDYIVNGEVTGARLEWAKKNFPKIHEPEIYFVPCMEWLAKNGARFKKRVKQN